MRVTNARFLIARNIAVACAIALLASACFKGESEDAPPDDTGGGGQTPVNQPPVISGSPPTSLLVGQAYDFTPSASDPDGDPLTFSIQNRPVWASFSTATGRLNGTPGAGDVGTFTNVRITVSDGQAQASLGAFSIAVNQIALGSVTLSWIPPTTNEDGTALTDLSGYRIYYGRSVDALDQTINIGNAGTTRWVIENLSPATWFFAMTSFRAGTIESERSITISTNVT